MLLTVVLECMWKQKSPMAKQEHSALIQIQILILIHIPLQIPIQMQIRMTATKVVCGSRIPPWLNRSTPPLHTNTNTNTNAHTNTNTNNSYKVVCGSRIPPWLNRSTPPSQLFYIKLPALPTSQHVPTKTVQKYFNMS